MAERLGLHAFAINEDDSLLMVPGAMMRVDTKKYELGIGTTISSLNLDLWLKIYRTVLKP